MYELREVSFRFLSGQQIRRFMEMKNRRVTNVTRLKTYAVSKNNTKVSAL